MATFREYIASLGAAGAVPEAANALRIPIQGAVGSVVEWMRGIYGAQCRTGRRGRRPKWTGSG